jgi:hypothetical protein
VGEILLKQPETEYVFTTIGGVPLWQQYQ